MAKTGAIRAGRAYVELFADDSPLVRGLRGAAYKLKQFGRTVTQMGRQMLSLAGMIALPIGLGVREYMRFEEQLAQVSTMVDDTAKHMGNFRAELAALAVEFGVSTEALSKGLYDILSAQIPASRAMELLREGTKAAIGGFTDANTSVSALITIMNAYGNELRDAADASDLLFQIVKRGRLTYEDLAQNLGKVAPTAAAVGVSMEEFGAALALVTRGMPDTERAATALANVIETFMKNTDDAKDAARALGIDMSTAGIRSEGLLYVIRQLAKVDPDRIAKIFPRRRALRGLIIAVQHAEELGVDIDTMVNRAGAAEEAFQKLAHTPMRELLRLWETIKKLSREIGGALMPVLKPLITDVAGVARDFAEWTKRNKEAVISIAKLAATLAFVGGAFILVGKVATVAGATIATFTSITVGAAAAGTKLSVVLAALRANLAGIALTGGVIAVVALTYAMADAQIETAKLSDEMQKQVGENDRLRKADDLRMRKLEQLSKREQLSQAQQREARTLIRALEGRYGDLGIAVDDLTGKLTGLSDAQIKLNRVMREARMEDLEEAIAELIENMRQLSAEQESVLESRVSLMKAVTGFGPGLGEAEAVRRIKKLGDEFIVAQKKLRVLQLELQGLRAGAAAVPVEPVARMGIEESEQIETDAARKIAQLEMKLALGGLKLRKALIDEETQYRIRKLEEAGASSAAIRNVEIEGELRKQILEKEARLRHKLDTVAKDERYLLLKAETELQGRELQKRKLAIEKTAALLRAKLMGEGTNFINAMFALKEKLLDVKDMEDVEFDVAGTFRAVAAWGLGTGDAADRTATATEESAKHLKRIDRRQAASAGGTFT